MVGCLSRSICLFLRFMRVQALQQRSKLQAKLRRARRARRRAALGQLLQLLKQSSHNCLILEIVLNAVPINRLRR
jgi:hypothetical protein